MRCCCLLFHDLERALARFLVIRDEARFCGRSFQDRPETFLPLVACLDNVVDEDGLSMSPDRC